MYIETERLIIRSTEPSDAKSYIDMASDGSLDEDIFCGCSREYEEWIPGWIQENIGLDKEDDPMKESIAYTIVEKESGLAVGSVGCSYYEDEKQVGLVYFVGAEYRGKGYASEAARAYAKYFLEHYEIPQLVVHIRNANKASCKTAENAGFTLVDTRMYQDYGDEVEKLYNFYEMNK